MKTYSGFEFWDGENTTTGQPHPLTGRMSIAGDLHLFASKEERDEWEQAYCEGRKRVATNRKDAKSKYYRGWSQADFDEFIESQLALLENEQ